MADTDISKLCSICYEQPPKYKCPRCMTATCSLPCYKKHQQRSSCNGKRDPSKYIKKSELATPSGFDHDYNYLKGLERTLEQADEDVNFDKTGDFTKAVTRGRQKDSQLEQYFRENGITVEHPPRGMARDLQNKTRMSKKKRVAWTVEWVDASGNREIFNDCADEATIAELYNKRLAEKRNVEKRKFDGTDVFSQSQARKEARRLAGQDAAAGPGRKKRTKTSHSIEVAPNASSSGQTKQQPETTGTQFQPSDEPLSESTKIQINNSDQVERPTTGHLGEGGESEPQPSSKDPTPSGTEQGEDGSGIKGESQSSHAQKQGHPKNPDRHFYLLRPSTAASVRVLAPIKEGSSLTKILRGRMVRGFPTIYVLPQQADSLPNEFVLEKAYLKSRKAEDKELRKLIEEIPNDGDELEEGEVKVPDGNSILDMLRRDVS